VKQPHKKIFYNIERHGPPANIQNVTLTVTAAIDTDTPISGTIRCTDRDVVAIRCGTSEQHIEETRMQPFKDLASVVWSIYRRGRIGSETIDIQSALDVTVGGTQAGIHASVLGITHAVEKRQRVAYSQIDTLDIDTDLKEELKREYKYYSGWYMLVRYAPVIIGGIVATVVGIVEAVNLIT